MPVFLRYFRKFILIIFSCIISLALFLMFYQSYKRGVSGSVRSSSSSVRASSENIAVEENKDFIEEQVFEEAPKVALEDIKIDIPEPELNQDFGKFDIPEFKEDADLGIKGLPDLSPPVKKKSKNKKNKGSQFAGELVFNLGDVDTKPGAVYRAKPVYPRTARNKHIEGTLIVKFMVDKNGNVQNPIILAAKPEAVFDESAVSAVKSWKFKPAVKDGKKVNVWVVAPIEFSLED